MELRSAQMLKVALQSVLIIIGCVRSNGSNLCGC